MFLLIQNLDNLVTDVRTFTDKGDLEDAFTAECFLFGVEANDTNFELGYMELECGRTICMCEV